MLRLFNIDNQCFLIIFLHSIHKSRSLEYGHLHISVGDCTTMEGDYLVLSCVGGLKKYNTSVLSHWAVAGEVL